MLRFLPSPQKRSIAKGLPVILTSVEFVEFVEYFYSLLAIYFPRKPYKIVHKLHILHKTPNLRSMWSFPSADL